MNKINTFYMWMMVVFGFLAIVSLIFLTISEETDSVKRYEDLCYNGDGSQIKDTTCVYHKKFNAPVSTDLAILFGVFFFVMVCLMFVLV